MVTYRPMIKEDAEAVAELYGLCFSQPWSLAAIGEMFTVPGYYSMVAVNEEKEIIAYVGYKAVFDEADITNVAVNPRMRRQGVAGGLLKALMEEAQKQEITSIFLEVRASNLAAITLYDHAGYVTCGRRKNYYQQPDEDAILMVWKKEE